MAVLQRFGVDENVVWADADPAGDQFFNDGRHRVMVLNTSGVDELVSVVAQRPDGCPENLLHDEESTVRAGELLEIEAARIARHRFNDPEGRALVTYSDATHLRVAIKRSI
jgi:hypothetical protein